MNKSQIKTMKPIKALKLVVFMAWSKVLKVEANTCISKCNLPSKDEALLNLVRGGYKLKPLWGNKELPVLKDDTKDLSIIIPVYNSERFLRQCLLSVLNQETHYDYEVICVNDGSKDGSLEILNSLKQDYPDKLFVVSQQNQGISAARNAGLALAKGRYVGFVDNDDRMRKDYIEKLMNEATAKDCDIVQCNHSTCDVSGKVLDTTKRERITFSSENQEKLFRCVSGYVWSGVYRKSLFTKLRFPLGFWYEDMITKIALSRQAKKISIIDDALYLKTSHGSNASITLWKRGDIKSADQWWLAQSFSEYLRNELHEDVSAQQYNVLLNEWYTLLWSRTKQLPTIIKKSIFVLAADYLISLNYTGPYFRDDLRMVDECYRSKNYRKWYYMTTAADYAARAKA